MSRRDAIHFQVRDALIHDGMITIHHDGTPGFAAYLIEHGVPEAQIAFTFHPPTPAIA
jgi:hypothetical protein